MWPDHVWSDVLWLRGVPLDFRIIIPVHSEAILSSVVAPTEGKIPLFAKFGLFGKLFDAIGSVP